MVIGSKEEGGVNGAHKGIKRGKKLEQGIIYKNV